MEDQVKVTYKNYRPLNKAVDGDMHYLIFVHSDAYIVGNNICSGLRSIVRIQ